MHCLCCVNFLLDQGVEVASRRHQRDQIPSKKLQPSKPPSSLAVSALLFPGQPRRTLKYNSLSRHFPCQVEREALPRHWIWEGFSQGKTFLLAQLELEAPLLGLGMSSALHFPAWFSQENAAQHSQGSAPQPTPLQMAPRVTVIGCEILQVAN